MMSKLLDKAGLLAEGKVKTEIVQIGVDKHVIVSEIVALDYSRLWAECASDEDDKGNVTIDMEVFSPLLLTYAIMDKDGERIFTDKDAPLLAKFGHDTFSKLLTAAKRLNGLMGDEGNDSEPTNDGSTIGE